MHAARLYSLEPNVPGIPIALPRRILKTCDYDYLQRKKDLAPLLPFLSKEAIARQKHPYYVVLLQEMMQAGYVSAAKELSEIFRNEEKVLDSTGLKNNLMVLVSNNKKVFLLADILRTSEEYESQGLYETAAVMRRELGQKLMKDKDLPLAQYFLQSALTIIEQNNENGSLDRLQAEIHCLLAFIARDVSDDFEKALESAVYHLTLCRELSNNQSWHFSSNVLHIRLKKPISLHGIRDEYETIDASTMSLYMVATLLEHEMMLELADQILFSHKFPSDQDIAQAHIFADNALRLAFEVHQPVALSSALLRFGVVLRHSGEYEDAIKNFKMLSNHAEVIGDNETYAVAQHNIALTYHAMRNTMRALECLVKQKGIANKNDMIDLEADALEELGLVLLQEGQLWEAEECCASAFEKLKTIQDKDSTATYHKLCEKSFAMCGISAGHHLWGRFAGLVRNETDDTLISLIDWKCRRKALPKVPRPDYILDKVADVYTPYHLGVEKPEQEPISQRLSLNKDDGDEHEEEELGEDYDEVDPKRMKSKGVYELFEDSEFEYLSDFYHKPQDVTWPDDMLGEKADIPKEVKTRGILKTNKGNITTVSKEFGSSITRLKAMMKSTISISSADVLVDVFNKLESASHPPDTIDE